MLILLGIIFIPMVIVLIYVFMIDDEKIGDDWKMFFFHFGFFPILNIAMASIVILRMIYLFVRKCLK